jgi:hypothetical protein
VLHLRRQFSSQESPREPHCRIIEVSEDSKDSEVSSCWNEGVREQAAVEER